LFVRDDELPVQLQGDAVDQQLMTSLRTIQDRLERIEHRLDPGGSGPLRLGDPRR